MRKRNRVIKTDSERNISGSRPSSNIFSYHSSRSVKESTSGRSPSRLPNQETLKPKEVSSTPWWYKLPSYIVIIVFIFCFYYVFTLTGKSKIEVLHGSNTEFLQPLNVYSSYANQLINSSWSNKFKLTINTDALADKIKEKFPELSGVSIVVPVMDHDPIVEIQPANPVAIASNKQGEFVINQAGTAILSISPVQASNSKLPLIYDQSGISYKVGESALSTSTISFITTVVYQLNAEKIPIQTITLVNVPYELNVQIAGKPYYVKFNILGNPRLEVGTFIATINQLNAMKTAPSQYVDVRISGRSYYQ
jgi:hypothetical protein